MKENMRILMYLTTCNHKDFVKRSRKRNKGSDPKTFFFGYFQNSYEFLNNC